MCVQTHIHTYAYVCSKDVGCPLVGLCVQRTWVVHSLACVFKGQRVSTRWLANEENKAYIIHIYTCKAMYKGIHKRPHPID